MIDAILWGVALVGTLAIAVIGFLFLDDDNAEG